MHNVFALLYRWWSNIYEIITITNNGFFTEPEPRQNDKYDCSQCSQLSNLQWNISDKISQNNRISIIPELIGKNFVDDWDYRANEKNTDPSTIDRKV